MKEQAEELQMIARELAAGSRIAATDNPKELKTMILKLKRLRMLFGNASEVKGYGWSDARKTLFQIDRGLAQLDEVHDLVAKFEKKWGPVEKYIDR